MSAFVKNIFIQAITPYVEMITHIILSVQDIGRGKKKCFQVIEVIFNMLLKSGIGTNPLPN